MKKLTSVEIYPDVSPTEAPVSEDVVEFKFVSLPNTPGPHFLFGSYNASTDTFKLYEDGVLVLTASGSGHGIISAEPTALLVGSAGLGATKTYDEVAFGVGVVSDSEVADLYAAASDYDAYTTAQLALTPFVYYHLDSDSGLDLTDVSGNGNDLNLYGGGTKTAESSLIAGTHGAIGVPTSGGYIGRYDFTTSLTILNGSWWMCGWVDSLDDYGTVMQMDGAISTSQVGFGFQPDDPGVSHFFSIDRSYSITSEVVTTPIGVPIVLSFRDPRALNPYNAVAIDGLDTDLIIPKYYGTGPDSKLYNLIRKKRNIVLQAGLNPEHSDLETYSQLRDDLYRIVSSSRTGLVQLRFKNGDTVVAAISGFVSKLESDQFSRDQEVKLTLECRDPMLKSLTPVELDFDISTPGKLILQDDKSTAPHGFAFVVKFNGTLPIFTVSSEADGFVFTITPRRPFIRNDLLYFSSDFNNKYLYMIRGSKKTHLADVLNLNPIWPIIFPGTNEYDVNVGVSWQSISHYETYWGV